MNRRRIAILFRELADAFDEPDDERAANDDGRKRARLPRPPHGPINSPTDTDRAAAREASRRLGHRVK